MRVEIKIACVQHEPILPWRQRCVTGPLRTRCKHCGTVMKYSSTTDIYGRGPR